MTNDESVLREVDEAIAEDRQSAFYRKNGPILIGGAAAVLIAVGGWQIVSARKAEEAGRAAIEFSTAGTMLEKSPDDGLIALTGIADSGTAGYAILADLRRAGALASKGDRTGGRDAYRKVYADRRAPQRLRELARIKAAMLSLPDGREAVLSDLGGLADSDSPFGPYAREISAVAAFDAKDYEVAHSMFESAANDPQTPEPVRERAAELAALAAAGRSGVNLTGEARVDDLQRALGGAGVEEDDAEDATDAADEGQTPAETTPEDGEDSNPGK